MAADTSTVHAEPRSPGWLPFLGAALFLAGAVYWTLSAPFGQASAPQPQSQPQAAPAPENDHQGHGH